MSLYRKIATVTFTLTLLDVLWFVVFAVWYFFGDYITSVCQ